MASDPTERELPAALSDAYAALEELEELAEGRAGPCASCGVAPGEGTHSDDCATEVLRRALEALGDALRARDADLARLRAVADAARAYRAAERAEDAACDDGGANEAACTMAVMAAGLVLDAALQSGGGDE